MSYRLPLKERAASVRLDRGLGAAFVPEWYVMSAIAAAAQVNAWDLCHHLVTQGFGVADPICDGSC